MAIAVGRVYCHETRVLLASNALGGVHCGIRAVALNREMSQIYECTHYITNHAITSLESKTSFDMFSLAAELSLVISPRLRSAGHIVCSIIRERPANSILLGASPCAAASRSSSSTPVDRHAKEVCRVLYPECHIEFVSYVGSKSCTSDSYHAPWFEPP